ncbi:putative coactivator CBP, KIX domain-containing protein [Rosa chinensis]|uniref:Putative coactivator CBP, KIX domain-containing protein n=1 Tax=Rosa chinensis TaxID=74649 RepID=A0A2P6QLK1_ROSCH|nr:putative coactivator CBP, KIX domain-containing protein [Rosa chinensis]
MEIKAQPMQKPTRGTTENKIQPLISAKSTRKVHGPVLYTNAGFVCNYRNEVKVTKKLVKFSDQRPPQGGEALNGARDWRIYLMPDSRQRIVRRCKTDVLKRHLPFSGQGGLLERQRIATRFEDKLYATASSQSDYLQKISLKLLAIETAGVATSPPSNLKRHRALAFERD